MVLIACFISRQRYFFGLFHKDCENIDVYVHVFVKRSHKLGFTFTFFKSMNVSVHLCSRKQKM